jgi:hypothetical protein
VRYYTPMVSREIQGGGSMIHAEAASLARHGCIGVIIQNQFLFATSFQATLILNELSIRL